MKTFSDHALSLMVVFIGFMLLGTLNQLHVLDKKDQVLLSSEHNVGHQIRRP